MKSKSVTAKEGKVVGVGGLNWWHTDHTDGSAQYSSVGHMTLFIGKVYRTA